MEQSVYLENLGQLRERIARACAANGRVETDVHLLPVTKNHPIEAVLFAEEAGLTSVGENRVQEAREKQADPRCPPSLRWELIGHLQSNKAKDAADSFWRVQSVDSEKLLNRLDRFAGECGKTLRILLQVNAGQDPEKYGVTCEGAEGLLERALACKHLQVDGFMTIAPLTGGNPVARSCFRRLRTLRDRLADATGQPLTELSMGMTDDLEEAIAEGSTQIRVGRALFGDRVPPGPLTGIDKNGG